MKRTGRTIENVSAMVGMATIGTWWWTMSFDINDPMLQQPHTLSSTDSGHALTRRGAERACKRALRRARRAETLTDCRYVFDPEGTGARPGMAYPFA